MSTTTDFDLEKLRMGEGELGPVSKSWKKNKGRRWVYEPKKGEFFHRGPIPRVWLKAAARLPGKSLHIAIELWFYVGLINKLTVSLNLSRLKTEIGVSRDSARRGVRQLEKAKLVSVERHAGRKPIITILLNQPRKRRKCHTTAKANGTGKESRMTGENG